MSYPTNAMISLAQVKAINNITDTTNDTFITAMIPVVQAAMETYCRRRFCQYQWIQWFEKEYELITDNWPINTVQLIGVPWEAFTIYDTTDLYTFSVSQANSTNLGIKSQLSSINSQTLVQTDFLFSTYTSIGALKNQVEVTLAGVTFTYATSPSLINYSNINTLTLRSITGKTVYAGINAFDIFANTSDGETYRLSDNSDRILLHDDFFDGYFGDNDPINTQDVLVIYNAGYSVADMPSDLQWVIASVIQDLIALNTASGGITGPYKSETLGDYSYTLGTNNSLNMLIYGDYAAGVAGKYSGMLDYYKRKVI